jgi:microcystin-dependent protein
LDFAGGAAPTGFLLAQGQTVSRTTYNALYGVLGTTWGAGDGSTTFGLPDCRSRVTVGAGQGTGLTSRALAATGGEENHALSIAELAAHAHGVNETAHNHTQNPHGTGITDGQHSHSVMSNPNGYAAGVLSTNVACSNTATYNVVTDGRSANITAQNATATNNTALTGITTQNNGSGAGHNTMPPFVVLNKIIKT